MDYVIENTNINKDNIFIKEDIIQKYYGNDGKKLHKVVDKILYKYGGISDKDVDDFYSLANEVFVTILYSYLIEKGTFDAYFYSCLERKIKTFFRDRNRDKRKFKVIIDETYVYVDDISIDAPIGGSTNGTIGEFLADNFDLEKEIIEEKREIYSDKMMKYLDRLSELQKNILKLTIAGYTSSEIITELHITQKEYSNANEAIRAYRNVSLLM